MPATRAVRFRPRAAAVRERFDLAFAFSVFTHISEAVHEACLRAIHASLSPGGILIVTVRSPAYLGHSDAMRPLLDPPARTPSRRWPSLGTCSSRTPRSRSIPSTTGAR